MNFLRVRGEERRRLAEAILEAGRQGRGVCVRIKSGVVEDLRFCTPSDVVRIVKRDDEVYAEISDDITFVLDVTRDREGAEKLSSYMLALSTEKRPSAANAIVYNLLQEVNAIGWVFEEPHNYTRYEADKRVEIVESYEYRSGRGESLWLEARVARRVERGKRKLRILF